MCVDNDNGVKCDNGVRSFFRSTWIPQCTIQLKLVNYLTTQRSFPKGLDPISIHNIIS
jgi:hypothetical protein